MLPRVPRHVGYTDFLGLTSASDFVTINTIRGDSESVVEIQPFLEPALWAIYLEESEMRYEAPPTDGRQEAPGAAIPQPSVPVNEA